MNALLQEETEHALDGERHVQRKASIVTVLALGLLFAAAFLLWLASRTHQVEALREIPAEQRRALFEATRNTLLTGCKPDSRPAGLDDYCQAQSAFLLKFDECDASCRDLAERSRPQPSR